MTHLTSEPTPPFTPMTSMPSKTSSRKLWQSPAAVVCAQGTKASEAMKAQIKAENPVSSEDCGFGRTNDRREAAT